ncbi:MAG: hypothetical protein OEY61_13075 [Gammaproteobacteria bacterium]|nr:hypothetical protein [Gammaproteobacteria bacterium]
MKYIAILLLLLSNSVLADDHAGLVIPPFPSGIENIGAALISNQNINDIKWSQNLVRINNVYYLWLNRFESRKNKKAYFKVTHTFQLPDPDNLNIYFATCKNQKTNEVDITAFATGQADKEWHTNITSAWKPNIKTGKIEAVTINNIICLNESYGL